MNWVDVLSKVVDLVPVIAQGGAGIAGAWRDRKKSPAERLAVLPRPVDAGLRAMVAERRRQADEAATPHPEDIGASD